MAYEDEVGKWVEEGWLEPYDGAKHGEVHGVVPLMAVLQRNKNNKVRPVMDYRELNDLVSSRPGRDVAVCQEKIRVWRRMGDNVCLLDLRKAYLQIHVAPNLHRYQAVKHKGQMYEMTTMGFGITSLPK